MVPALRNTDPALRPAWHPVARSAEVGAGLMVENFFDIAHFPCLHAAAIGTKDAETFDFTVERAGFGMTVHSTHAFPNHEDPGVATGERPLVQHRRLEYRYRAPFLVC